MTLIKRLWLRSERERWRHTPRNPGSCAGLRPRLSGKPSRCITALRRERAPPPADQSTRRPLSCLGLPFLFRYPQTCSSWRRPPGRHRLAKEALSGWRRHNGDRLSLLSRCRSWPPSPDPIDRGDRRTPCRGWPPTRRPGVIVTLATRGAATFLESRIGRAPLQLRALA